MYIFVDFYVSGALLFSSLSPNAKDGQSSIRFFIGLTEFYLFYRRTVATCNYGFFDAYKKAISIMFFTVDC